MNGTRGKGKRDTRWLESNRKSKKDKCGTRYANETEQWLLHTTLYRASAALMQ